MYRFQEIDRLQHAPGCQLLISLPHVEHCQVAQRRCLPHPIADLAADRQRFCQKRGRLFVVSLRRIELPQVVQHRSDFGLRARPAQDLQRLLVGGQRLRVVAARTIGLGHVVERGRLAISIPHLLQDRERLLQA